MTRADAQKGRIMMATRNTPPLWTQSLARLRSGLSIAGQALLLIVCAALAYLYILAADAMINAPEPETRCFTAADRTQNYCRSQHNWR